MCLWCGFQGGGCFFVLIYFEMESFAKMSSQNPCRSTKFCLLNHVNRLCFNSPHPPQKNRTKQCFTLSWATKKKLNHHITGRFLIPYKPQMNPGFFHCSVGFPPEIPAEIAPGVVVSSALGLRDLKRPRRLVVPLTGWGLRKWFWTIFEEVSRLVSWL